MEPSTQVQRAQLKRGRSIARKRERVKRQKAREKPSTLRIKAMQAVSTLSRCRKMMRRPGRTRRATGKGFLARLRRAVA